MTIFDLIFLMAFLVVLVGLGLVFFSAVFRKWRYLKLSLVGLVLFLVLYFGVLVLVSITSPQEVILLGEEQCSDDWCISVGGVERSLTGTTVRYTVTLVLHSRARGRPQRELGNSVYLVDEAGSRYEPLASPGEPGLDVLLQPGESVSTNRVFELQLERPPEGLIVTRGKIPGMFIIGGRDSLLHKETIFRLEPD